jgi:hypothetical protein
MLIGGEIASNVGLELWVRSTLERLKNVHEQLALADYQARPGMSDVSPTLPAVGEMPLRTE